ncbi:SusC/RagA family TonB-linked outer membrane protein [Marinilabilia salmonicolor]|uniref:TonB-linked SusC/RagA family outer membrane protein n=1 Tax=Marinilabilia salmonicolor TaxID=989 RepID=A0A368UJ58_9BACT|nr:SusC/RagA family TonB-linked outer membrane protein [Marinilabilia salmonicolor]RCW26075.1 TonB-linked SusC/RagA family outer membrane protein [Marinilabilia salmonicolor]
MKKVLLALSFLMVFGLGSVLAQAQTISGTVTGSEDGMPIPGVSVFVKGTTVGTVTNIDGAYSLSVPEEAETLVFSFIGMKTQEIPFEGQENIDVEMVSEFIAMDEVVVTALGLSRAKKAIGYASTSVDGEEIARSESVNPMSALQGKVAGLDVSSAPGPGATQNVIIRGASSFGNNQPLYIVDGVPITNEQNRSGDNLNSQVDFGSGINALNPDDIEDLTVLKGAAATALYGSRAANGVIMVTTKSGGDTGGKLNVSYDGSYTISRVSRLPETQSQFGQGWSGDRALDENGNWGAPYDGKDRVWGNIVDNTQQIKPYVYLEDRVRDFYEYGKNMKNSLSLSGGTSETNYYLSLSQNNMDGVVPTDADSYDRYTVATNASHTAGKLTVSSSVNFSTESTSSVPSGQGTSVFRSLYEIPEDVSIVDMEDYTSKFNNLDNYFTPYGVNPYYVLNKDGATQDKNKIFGKFQIDYEMLESLKFTYRFGGDYETSISETHTAIIEYTPGSINDERNGPTSPGNYQEMRRTRIQMNHDFMALFNYDFSSDFSLDFLAGLNINDRRYNWLSGSINSIDIPGFYDLANSLSPSVSDQYKEKRRLMGVYGTAEFSFRNYLYATLTARNDWSSTLPEGNNSFFYPGATVSFILSDFMNSRGANLGVLSFAKFRAAYGMTGNDTEPYYVYDRYVPAFSGNPGYPDIDDLTFPLGGVNSYMASNVLGNPDLDPEITSEAEFGVETRFFNNRFGIDLAYYNRLTEGLIATLPKDPSSGYTQQRANLGDIRNEGIELVVDGYPVRGTDFQWHISVNYSTNENTVESLEVDDVFLGGFGGGGIYAVEGMPIGQFKFPMAEKVEIDGEMYTVVDGSGNPQATTDQEFLGKDINEDFRAGLTNTFSWKGLSLATTFDLRYGGYIYSYTKDYMHWTGSSPESVFNDRKPFLVPNSVIDNGDGTYSENNIAVDPTALHTFYSQGGFQAEDFAVIDKSYLKLRNISLSYELPESLVERLNLNSVTMSLNASNILLWTPAENPYVDPEITTFGNDVSAKFGEFGANPTNEFYTFGLTFGF